MELQTRIIFLFFLQAASTLQGERSLFRKKDPLLPAITTFWVDDPHGKEEYSLRDSHLEQYSLFELFDIDYFNAHMIPTGPITYRYDPQKTVNGAELGILIEQFLKELKDYDTRRRSYKDFTVIKVSEYNPVARSGMLVMKFRKYPFVVKLFMETPCSFVRPFSKGFVPSCLFLMSGGVNRHLLGFTRIPNLQKINTMISTSPEWSKILETPRKWYWQPRNNRWFRLVGYNIGGKKEQSIDLPSVYALICDAIDVERTLTMRKANDLDLGRKLGRFFGNRLDQHIDNFVIERTTKKIVLIDTEHFATMVGLKEPTDFKNYAGYYSTLSWHCVCKGFFRSKKERLAVHHEPPSSNLMRLREAHLIPHPEQPADQASGQDI